MTAPTFQFFYGNYTHPSGEVAFANISRQIKWSATQRANILEEAWSLKGKFVYQGPTSQAAIYGALKTTRKAYSGTNFATNGYSAGFYLDGARTPFLLDASKAIGGVVVTNPISHGAIQGAEGVTYLNYTFGLKMDSFLSSTNDLLEYRETLTFSDAAGRPLQVWRTPLNGLPIPQTVGLTWYDCVQQGELKQRTPNPQPEQMLFPSSLLGEHGSQTISFSSPSMIRGTPTEWGVTWSYKFRQSVPFTGGQVHARG